MRRIAAWLMTLWYALMVSGIYLHVHYCCGRVLDVSMNPASAICSSASPDDHSCLSSTQPTENEKGCCSSTGCNTTNHHEAPAHEWSQSCCSTDDFYIAIEDAHDKSAFSFNAIPPVKTAGNPTSHPEITDEPLPVGSIEPRAGPPLYLLFVSRIDYA